MVGGVSDYCRSAACACICMQEHPSLDWSHAALAIEAHAMPRIAQLLRQVVMHVHAHVHVYTYAHASLSSSARS